MQILFDEAPRLLGIAAGLDVEFRAGEQDSRRAGREFLGLPKGAVRFLDAAAAGEKARKVDDTADLFGRELHSAPEVGLGVVVLLLLLGKLGEGVLGLGGVERANPVDKSLGFLKAAAEETWGFKVVAEEVVDSLFVGRIERHGLFEALAGFGSVRGRNEHVGSLGAAAPGTAEPEPDARIAGTGFGGLLEGLNGFLVVPKLVMGAAEEEELIGAADSGRRIQKVDGLAIFSALKKRTCPVEVGRPGGRRQEQANEP